MAKKALKTKKVSFKRGVLYLCSLCAAVLVLSLSGLSINSYLDKRQVLSEAVDLAEEKLFWEEVVSQHPTYLDGWLELAKVSYKLGETSLAKKALGTAYSIDPNNLKVMKLEKELF